MLRKLLAVFALLTLACAGAVSAQVPLLTPPPASVCTSPTVPTEPGDIHMFPGRWWNPKRYGTGWDFFYGDGQQRMYLTWFTFDGDGRPVWLHGEAKPVTFNAISGERTWQSRLYLAAWNRHGERTFSEVGLVSVTFPNQTTTRAAVRWKWNVDVPGNRGVRPVDENTHDECLLDTYRDPQSPLPGEGVNELNQAFSSNWFFNGPPNSVLGGWGVDLLIDLRPSDHHYIETATAAIFDDHDRPVWMQSVDDWGTSPPAGNTMNSSSRGNLRYLRHNLPGATHPAITDCPKNATINPTTCIRTAYGDTLNGTTNRFLREILTARTGKMTVKASVPDTVTGGAAVIWPPVRDQETLFPDPVPVTHEDSNHIIVDQSICRVPLPTDTCTFTVSWVTDDSGAMIHKIDLNNNGQPTLIASGLSNWKPQTLRVGDRFQYRLTYRPVGGGQQVTHRTPEVRVLLNGNIPDENLEPVDCESGEGCDLGAHDPTVGAVAGEASAEGGTAGYSIPISLPPGRNGMQPGVALSYNSGQGNEIAGMGWGVSGLSSIHRCARTVAQDGAQGAAPVSFNQTDALCLDGERLVLAAGSKESYGEAGALYRTEIDSFVRVEQKGGDLANGSEELPTCFIVRHKSGRVSNYGGVFAKGACEDGYGPSRTTPAGAPAPMNWKISRTEDELQNNVIYRYANFGSGELLIDRILYTGKDGGEGNRIVRFGYEPRGGNDRSATYLFGALLEQTQRLKTIASSVGDVRPTTYTLSYRDPVTLASTSLSSGRSLLQSVTQCAYTDPPEQAGDLHSMQQCLAPTLISWNDAPADYFTRQLQVEGLPDPAPLSDTAPVGEREVIPVGDYDGDGVRELYVRQYMPNVGGEFLVRQSPERVGRGVLEISDIFLVHGKKGLYADFDADGRTDILAAHDGSVSSTLALYQWKHDRTDPFGGPSGTPGVLGSFNKISVNIPTGGVLVSTDDVDHDGYPDLLMRRRPGNCNVATLPTGPHTNATPPFQMALCFYRNATTRAPGAASAQIQFEPGVQIHTWEHPVTNGGLAVDADFNGDGVRDPMIRKSTYFVAGAYSADVVQSVLWSVPAGKSPNPLCQSTPSPHFQLCTPAAMGLPEAGQGYTSRGAVSHWIDVNGDKANDLLYAVPSTCPASGRCTAQGSWHLQLSDGRTFLPAVAVQGGGEALLQQPAATGASFRYASRLAEADVDSDGRTNLLFPVDLAARHCEAVVATFPKTNGVCTYPPATGTVAGDRDPCNKHVWMCASDVAFDLGLKSSPYALPPLSSMQDLSSTYYGAAIAVDDSYGPQKLGMSNLFYDRSLYSMAALRFVPEANGAWRAETVRLDQNVDASGIPRRVLMAMHFAEERNISYDMYGDGLADIRTSAGCYVSDRYYKQCQYIGDGNTGPTAFHVSPGHGQPLQMTNVSALNARATRTLINENVGAAEVPSGAPVLPEMVRSIVNGLGDTAQWDYAPLSAKAGRGASELPLYEILPQQASYADARHYYFQSTMPVVTSFAMSNGVGGMDGHRSWRFGYREAMYNHAGRGFQGFRTIVKEHKTATADAARRQRVATTFHQKFPLTGKVEKIESGIPLNQVSNGIRRDVVALARETYDWGCDVAQQGANCDTANALPPASFPYLRGKIVTTYDLAKAEATQVEAAIAETATRNFQQGATAAGWDAYGNLLFQEIESKDLPASPQLPAQEQFVTSQRKRTENVFDPPQVSQWWVDRLSRTTVTTFPVEYGSAHPLPVDATNVQQAHSLVTAYIWNPDRTLQQTTLQPDGGADQKLVTRYEYPSPNYGLANVVRQIGKSTESQQADERVTTTQYDAQSYFVTSVTDLVAANSANPTLSVMQTTTTTHRPSDGQVSDVRAASGLRKRSRFDAFGRVIRIDSYDIDNRLDQQPVRVAWNRCTAGNCDGLVGHGGNDVDASTVSLQANAAYRVTTVKNGSPTAIAWFDVLGRTVKKASRGFDSTFVVEGTAFDSMGTLRRQTVPFQLTSPLVKAPANTRYTYDRIGRTTRKQVYTQPGVPLLDDAGGNLVTDYSYSGQRTDIRVRGRNVAECTPGLWQPGADSRCMLMQRYAGVAGLMRTVDTQLGVTRYWYDGSGHTVALADASAPLVNGQVGTGRATTATYDARGRRISGFDPNQGSWQASFNAFDEAQRQVDARGAVTAVQSRDQLGRALAQTRHIPLPAGATATPAGVTRSSMRDVWRYDPVHGQLAEVAHCELSESSTPPANCVFESATWGERYTYDRSVRTDTVVSDQAVRLPSRSRLTTKFLYDSVFGREKAIEYPSGLRVQRRYQKFGALRDLLDADTGERFWGVGATDAWGGVTRQDYGNGFIGEYASSPVTGQSLSRRWRSAAHAETPLIDSIEYAYDSLGNLSRQTRRAPNTLHPEATERYYYDSLQRLTQALPDTLNVLPVNYAYDAAGNLTKKSDFSLDQVPAYLYPATPSSAHGCGPNVAIQVQLRGGSAVLDSTCDKNGNIITATHSGDAYSTRTLRYDPANRLTEVRRAGLQGPVTTRFLYAPDGRRVFEDLEEQYWPGSGLLQQRHQIIVRGIRGFSMEIPSDSAGNGTWGSSYWGNSLVRHELGDVGVTYQHTEGNLGKVVNVAYRTSDRLGSPLGLMNDAGEFTQRADNGSALNTRRSFDAFGQTRESDFRPRQGSGNIPFPGPLALTPATRDGFTGHEHLDSVGLIHMNGRAYDYQLGRFLSVDPVVQFPTNSQSLNPYSYILNNPLSGTDPSGFRIAGDDNSGEAEGGSGPGATTPSAPNWNGAQQGTSTTTLEPVEVKGVAHRGLMETLLDGWVILPDFEGPESTASTVAESNERRLGEDALGKALADYQFSNDGKGLLKTYGHYGKKGACMALEAACEAAEAAAAAAQGDTESVAGAMGSPGKSRRRGVRDSIDDWLPPTIDDEFTVEGSLGIAKDVRRRMQVGKRRNVAFAVFKINGERGHMVGVSGEALRKGGAHPPELRRFRHIPEPGNGRFWEAEGKIFETLSNLLPSGSTGTMYLFSELPLCTSCGGMAEQFREAYPGINLTIQYGPLRE